MIWNRSIHRRFWLLTNMLLILTCEPATKAPTTGDIEGTILDASTSQPISGATVTSEPITSSKTTDSEGAYLIEGVEPETYTIQSSKSGYTSNTTTIKVIAGEVASADIQLSEVQPELSVTPIALDFGNTITTLPLTISNAAEGQLDWTIAEGATWITVLPTSESTTSEQAAVSVIVDRSGIDAGEYTESIIVISNGGSATITVSLTVEGPVLIVSTNTLNFGTTSTSLTFNVVNGGVDALNYTSVYSANWLTVTPTTGTATSETDVITVVVDRTGMPFGNHYETISMTSNANSETVDVLMTVPNPNAPQLSVSPLSLDLSSDQNSADFNISNTGTGTLTWNITDDKNWIAVSTTSGTTDSEVDAITVSVDRVGLTPNTYSGTVTIASDGGNQTVAITMIVPDEPTISVSPAQIDFGTAETIHAFTVSNIGSGDLTWTVTDNQGWMSTNPESGTNFGSVNITVDRTGLASGDYSGTVSVSSNGGNGSVSVLMNIPADEPPSAITLLDPTDITETSMALQWTRNFDSDFAAYKLYRDSTPAVTQSSDLIKTILNSAENNYSDTGLQGGTAYYYRVYAMDMAQQYTASNVVSGTTLTPLGDWSMVATLGVNLRGIDFLNEDFAVTVGSGGSIFFWDGSNWIEEASPTASYFWDVMIVSQTDIWAVASDGVYHYNGISWSQPAGAPSSSCYSIDGLSADSIWVGSTGGGIYFYNGTDWMLSDLAGDLVWDIKMNSSTDGWAIERFGRIYHYNGIGWSIFDDLPGSTYYGIKAFSASDIWIGSTPIYDSDDDDDYPYNVLYHWDGVTWHDWGSTSSAVAEYHAIDGVSSADVWFVTEAGYMYHWDGNAKRYVQSPTTSDLWDIKMITTNDGWAVGDGGVILRYH